LLLFVVWSVGHCSLFIVCWLIVCCLLVHFLLLFGAGSACCSLMGKKKGKFVVWFVVVSWHSGVVFCCNVSLMLSLLTLLFVVLLFGLCH